MHEAWIKIYDKVDILQYEIEYWNSTESCCFACVDAEEDGFYFEDACCCLHYGEYKERYL